MRHEGPDPVVFVVDDDPSIRDALTSLLRSVGLRVETFESARAFLTRQPSDVPGCLVLDVRLPGLSGLELQRELSEAEMHIPIIFITGHGDIPMTVQAMKAGAVEFLTKPFCDQDLARRHVGDWSKMPSSSLHFGMHHMAREALFT